MTSTVRVAVNGYGVIGKRVADAVALQGDMTLSGVADVVSDYRIRVAVERGYAVYASLPERKAEMATHQERAAHRPSTPFFVIRAGTPIAWTWSGTSLVTSDPAPITDPLPIFSESRMMAPIPT